VIAASQVPLPPEEDEEEDANREKRRGSVSAASGYSHNQKSAEAPATVSPGWGASFLAANQAALTSATQAVAQDIAAAKSPAPAAAVAAAAPVLDNGWVAALLAKNPSQLSTANAAEKAEVEAMKRLVASGAFEFGVTPNVVHDKASSAPADTSVSEEVAAPSQAPVSSVPAAAAGWDMGFLQKSQAALASASEATAVLGCM
jgi:hypothetical protein